MGNLGPGAAAIDLSELHEPADLTGAVRRVATDRDALLPRRADDPYRGLGVFMSRHMSVSE